MKDRAVQSRPGTGLRSLFTRAHTQTGKATTATLPGREAKGQTPPSPLFSRSEG